MNIYLVSQNDNNGWDTFDSFVCYASNEEEARRMLPDTGVLLKPNEYWDKDGKHDNKYSTWALNLNSVNVKLLGSNVDITESKVILASFNAG